MENQTVRVVGNVYPLAVGEKVPASMGVSNALVRAKATGEFRAPKKGEWFLSGSIVEAYEAKTNMTRAYGIAVLVTGRVIFEEGSHITLPIAQARAMLTTIKNAETATATESRVLSDELYGMGCAIGSAIAEAEKRQA